MQSLTILTAVLPEAQAIARALNLTPHKYAAHTWHQDAHLYLHVIGIRARHLPTLHNPTAILLAGLAGGISPTLRVGDLVLQSTLKAPQIPLPFIFGAIHTASDLIATPAQKKSLFDKTGCPAVDMETEPVRQFASTHDAPFLAVRAISDAFSDHLDPAMMNLVDGLGQPRIGRAISLLALKPWKLKAMLRLKKNVDFALKNLGVAVAAIVDSGWPGAKENAAD